MKLSKPLQLLITAIALAALIFAVSKIPSIAEWYAATVYPVLAWILSFVSSLFPFSLYDVFTVLAVAAFVCLIVLIILRKVKWSRGLYIITYSVLIIIAWFYFSWGFAYFRNDFYTRCNIQKSEYSAEHFRRFAADFVSDANSAYICMTDINKGSIDIRIECRYENMKDVLKINYPNGKRKTKPMLYECLHTGIGISGYFGPFFNEVHVNNFALDMEYPFTLAHEKAHQFGVASEAECNLYAFIVCASSHDAQLRYSAYVSTIPHVLNDYRKAFPNDYENILRTVDSRIIADLIKISDHWLGAQSQTMSDIHKAVYDSYLKANSINSGIKNYSEVVSLLVSTYNIFVK